MARGLKRQWVDHFENKLALVEVHAAARGARKAGCADFGRTGMVEALCAPRVLDPLAHAGNAAARLSRLDSDADRTARGVQPFAASDIRQVQRVSGRAHQHRRVVFQQAAQALLGRHAAARNAQRANQARRLECAPEANERPEAKGKEDTVAVAYACGAVYCPPAAQPPLPGRIGVQPAQRAAGRA